MDFIQAPNTKFTSSSTTASEYSTQDSRTKNFVPHLWKLFKGLKAIDPTGDFYFGSINLQCTSASILKGVQVKLVGLTNAFSSTNLLLTGRIL